MKARGSGLCPAQLHPDPNRFHRRASCRANLEPADASWPRHVRDDRRLDGTIAKPLAGNSNVHLCVGTALAGPLLHWAGEPPGFFHIYGPSKIAKSLAAGVGQSVWGLPKVPGAADAFGASWTATS